MGTREACVVYEPSDVVCRWHPNKCASANVCVVACLLRVVTVRRLDDERRVRVWRAAVRNIRLVAAVARRHASEASCVRTSRRHTCDGVQVAVAADVMQGKRMNLAQFNIAPPLRDLMEDTWYGLIVCVCVRTCCDRVWCAGMTIQHVDRR
jgi:hypothetical protein